jgi:hypothetical protein
MVDGNRCCLDGAGEQSEEQEGGGVGFHDRYCHDHKNIVIDTISMPN